MKHSDFYIGLEFIGSAGFWYRCTDIGTRTITAICLSDRPRDPKFYQGPPYIVEEKVFDEREIKFCDLTTEDSIISAMDNPHPGYPNDIVKLMIKEWDSKRQYHAQGIFRHDRIENDELLHPYGAEWSETHKQWNIKIYYPFIECFGTMNENDFISLPIATEDDIVRIKKNRS